MPSLTHGRAFGNAGKRRALFVSFSVKSGGVSVLNRGESEMVRVSAGAFEMGISSKELTDVQEACKADFGDEAEPLCRGQTPLLLFVDARVRHLDDAEVRAVAPRRIPRLDREPRERAEHGALPASRKPDQPDLHGRTT